MNCRQLLYKDNLSRVKENRGKLMINERKSQRKDLHNLGRNLSPTQVNVIKPLQKVSVKNEKNVELEKKQISKSKHKEQFLKRYIKWKNKKKEEQEKLKEKRKPFVVPGISKGIFNKGIATSETKSSIKSSKFQPPKGLKTQILEKLGESTFLSQTESRRSVYTFVETPQKSSTSSQANRKNFTVTTNLKTSIPNEIGKLEKPQNIQMKLKKKKDVEASKTQVKLRKPIVLPKIIVTPERMTACRTVKSKFPTKINEQKSKPTLKLKIKQNIPEIVVNNDFSNAVAGSISCHFTSAKNSNSVCVRLSDTFSDTISPVEPIKLSNSKPKINEQKIETVKKNFQFVRYEEVMPTTPIPMKKTIDEDVNKTPPNEQNKSTYYVSPFVSVSRGKVNLQKEKEKRESIYFPNKENNSNCNNNSNNNNKNITEMSIQYRRTMEAVSYFEKQLKNEFDRLQMKCELWEEYKLKNVELLATSDGDDMINATIGQTKLLTSKKLKQFADFIEQCKNCAIARIKGETLKDNGSENSKLILAEDLEGFWCVITQQIENLDKRFENLKNWQSNDWVDPEISAKMTAVVKNKKSLTKIIKPKATKNTIHASSALKDMLRTVRAACKENKNHAKVNIEKSASPLVMLTPSKRKSCLMNSGCVRTPPQISVIVQNRRSRSIAPTVITVNSTKKFNNRKSKVVNSPKYDTKEFEIQRTSEMTDFKQEKCDNFQIQSPEKIPSSIRKSILKTPGTISKSKTPKRIAFNEISIKKFNFVVNDDVLEVSDED